MLTFYARRFPTVEAHATYRRLPSVTAIERWMTQVPLGFKFAVKAHMGITHRRDLDGVEERMAAFFEAVAPLGAHLGPVLFAVPHQQPDLHRLDRLLGALPRTRPGVAFELGPAWATPDVLKRLEAHDATLVLVEVEGRPAPDLEVGPFAYVRLRCNTYNRAALEGWAERLEGITAGGRDAYAFFRHDETGNGPRYARQVNGRLSGP
jgi:uncharacterized protein YecE (DUF72 family)